MLTTITAGLRLLLLLIIGVLTAIISVLFYKITPHRYWLGVVRIWARFMLWLNGVQLQVIDKPSSPSYTHTNSIVIANHISWLDTMILYSIYYINFIGKVEMRRWPLLSSTIKAGGTIFINRNNKRDLIEMNLLLSQKLLNGACIGLFPEGRVSDGQTILPFKPALLEAAIKSDSTIIPIVLLYYRSDGHFANEASYANYNLLQTILNTLKLKRLIVKAVVLEPLKANSFSSRHALAKHLHQAMNNIYNSRRLYNNE